MALFANGTDQEIYEAQWCQRCLHHDEEKGCPVMTAHLVWCGDGRRQDVLDMLIPDEPGELGQCRMFMSAHPCPGASAVAYQRTLFDRFPDKEEQVDG